jgi:signal transduction histidine kinase
VRLAAHLALLIAQPAARGIIAGRQMKPRAALFLLAPALVALAPTLFAQPTNYWRVFTRADGLAENACVSVTLGASGNVLVRHLKSASVSVLDGYDVTIIPEPGTWRHRVYESPGGQLWSVIPSGLQEFRDGQWVSYGVTEIAEHFQAGRTNEIPLLPVRQGRVLVLLPDRLLQFGAEDPEQPRVETLRRADQTTLGTFTKMTSTPDGALWLAGARGFEMNPGPVRNLKLEQVWVPTNQVPAEWLAQPSEPPSPDELSVRRIFDVAVDRDDVVWVGTSDGLFRGAPMIWKTADRPSSPRPESKPGINLPLDLPEDIARIGGWQSTLTARNGDVWLASERALAWRHQSAWRVFSSTNQIGPEGVTAFAEAADGRIWCATPGKVWEFDGRNWLDLRSGFARINGLCSARNGTLWVATDEGAYRNAQDAWIANGEEDGLPARMVRTISEDAAGHITATTSQGAATFHPEADTEAPRTFILTKGSEENNYPEGATVTLAFRGRDKWKLTAAGRLLFSYRLDEREWSTFQEFREISFGELPLGKHYFQVRAMDRNANIDPKPARFEFAVVVPWYRETRLVLILSVALGLAVFFAALAVNRHRKLKLSYARVERTIAERTHELEIANRELLHSQKMNALGTLSAGIAHDFNNILSIIKGSAQIIEDNLDQPEKIQTRLDRIKTVVQQGAGIVEAMLGFSRSSDHETDRSNVNVIVDDTLKLLGDRFLREVVVRFDRGENLPEIAVARDFVQQVLLNFIFNAADAMTDRKRITLATRLVKQLPEAMALPPARAGSFIAIAVNDSGGGIAPENLPRIFEPFFTTKAMSARRGTGLGLSMVYELAKKLEAGLAVETTAGAGSTFTIFLPVKSAPTRPAPSDSNMRP